MVESRKAALAREAMVAVEPLVELFLELGVTSPEAESLLRGIFVHQARKWLANQSASGEDPSDVRVSLVTGIHRNFVRRILSEPPKIATARELRGPSAARLLEAWHSEPKYVDSSGKPRDLPERDHEPSFQSLSAAFMPGIAPSVVMDELLRAGLIQTLSDHRVRVRSRYIRESGVNVRSVSDMGTRAASLIRTLHHNLRNPVSRLYCEATHPFHVDPRRISIIRNIINRQASSFIHAIESEIGIEAEKAAKVKRRERVKVGLTVFQTEILEQRRS